MDWGMALSVGLAVAIVSELTILGAIILPKIPIEAGKTWRGTVTAVSGISLVIGGAGGYIAGQFGGRGGGGALTQGQSVVSTQTAVPIATQTSKVEPTKPARPETYLANQVDLYFVRDPQTKLIANFTCKLVAYRRKGSQWEMVGSDVAAKDLTEFLKKTNDILEGYQKDMLNEDLPNRRLRLYLDPFPGEGVYDQLRKQGEAKGWKVDRRDVTWQPEGPNS